MVDARIIEEWLKKADEDFEFASSVVEISPFYAQICFHFHQAAEKYLKAFIIAHEIEFKKIHDLPVLLKGCMLCDPSFDNTADAVSSAFPRVKDMAAFPCFAGCHRQLDPGNH